MEEQINHPKTVEVFISYFFKWGIAPFEKKVLITWDRFNELTGGRASSYPIKTWADVETFRKTRFNSHTFADGRINSKVARQMLGVKSDILPMFINIFRLK